MNRSLVLIFSLLLITPILSGCGTEILGNKTKTPAVSVSSQALNYVTSTDSMVTTTKSVAPSSTKLISNNSIKKKTMDKFDPNKQYVAKISTTIGDLIISFNKGQTPKTVENFVTLAKKGFYDKTIFHRVIKGFMIQGGDPLGNGTGGPGYKFDDEPFDGEYLRGTVAMANSGPNTNGSQFFIMHADYPLPKNYVIFGRVVSGMETVDKIAQAQVKSGGFGEISSPVNPVSIKSIEVTEE
jgi:cyclophilin family peptidyl-prolyl cis-trans isomerase